MYLLYTKLEAVRSDGKTWPFRETKKKPSKYANKDVSIYLNNKLLEQVNTIKYLGIIIDSKLNFREHLIYTSKKCSKLIIALSKSAKLSWELKHEALNTIYKGAVLPLMLYGVPVWIEAMAKNATKFYTPECNV